MPVPYRRETNEKTTRLAVTMQNRKPTRLKKYDYSQDGYYFVTVCVQDMKRVFGDIKNSAMALNECGEIAKTMWLEIPQHFENIQLDKFTIMPNHIHGIIIIDNDNVGNGHARSLQMKRQHQTLPVVVGAFKSVTTNE